VRRTHLVDIVRNLRPRKPESAGSQTTSSDMQSLRHPIPECILRSEEWPWWRRTVKRPPEWARAASKSWRGLVERVRVDDWRLAEWPDASASGIFGNSIVRADHLSLGDPNRGLRLLGWRLAARRVREVFLECPVGSLFKQVSIDPFEFDITEVDGIASSKSMARCFPSVDAFGAAYVAFCESPISANGLSDLLAHPEIRVKPDGSGSDHLSLRIWDGRLFLDNSGGSHHFAGAAHVARETGASVPFKAQLIATALRPSAVNWLLKNHHVLAARSLLGSGMGIQVARLTESCFRRHVPQCVAKDTELLVIPRTSRAAQPVSRLLVEAGARDAAPWFRSLLADQERYLAVCAHRFNSRFDFLAAFDESGSAAATPASHVSPARASRVSH
jgi:hypothetical protein